MWAFYCSKLSRLLDIDRVRCFLVSASITFTMPVMPLDNRARAKISLRVAAITNDSLTTKVHFIASSIGNASFANWGVKIGKLNFWLCNPLVPKAFRGKSLVLAILGLYGRITFNVHALFYKPKLEHRQ